MVVLWSEDAIVNFPHNPKHRDVEPGRLVLSRYTVLGKLTQGGMAEVYLAKQKGPAGYTKLIVLKRVRPHLADDKDFVAMFANEARVAALINHPNVVQIFDLGQDDDDWFLAMEFLDGRDMLQVGRGCRALNRAVPFEVTARIIADACNGLDHAHRLVGSDGKSLNLVHRDMSPENILITFEGQVKVVDFGIAKARDNAFRTQAGQIKGKLGYVPPEAILGKPLDGRADIFAMGATLYLFLCGRPAFTGNNPMEIFERSLQPPEAPSKINPRVPPALESICLRCLAREPSDRYARAGELAEALDSFVHQYGRPMGANQLAQFMKVLFPPDADPLRQRIDAILAADSGAAGAEPAPPVRSPAPVPEATRPVSAVEIDDLFPEQDDEEQEATSIVAPEDRPQPRAPQARPTFEEVTAEAKALPPQVPSIPPRSAVFRSVDLAEQFAAPAEEASRAAEAPESTAQEFASEPSGAPLDADDDDDVEVTQTGAPPSARGLEAQSAASVIADELADLSIVDDVPAPPTPASAPPTDPRVSPHVAFAATTEAEGEAAKSLRTQLPVPDDHLPQAVSARPQAPPPSHSPPLREVIEVRPLAVPPSLSRRLGMFAAGLTVGLAGSVAGLWAMGELSRLRDVLGL
ncbi:MAG: serine/threonine protein kinase [Myxococcota bacterium]